MSDTLKTYLPDTSVFITAKNHYYSFDIAPCFWNCIIAHSAIKRVLLIDRVVSEAKEHKDELSHWINVNFKDNTTSTDNARCIEKNTEIDNWVNNQSRFKQASIRGFLRGADPWLIAYAKANDAVVVTQEESRPESTKVSIPDVCIAFQVRCINTFDMLRELGVCWQ